MLSADISGHRFQLRAAAIVIDDGFVLLHRPEGDACWTLPGGRVEAGEDARTAVVREFQEELGEGVDPTELVHVVENFFELHGRSYHEVGLYFGATLHPASPLRDKARRHDGIEGDKRLEFRWFPRGQLEGLALRPAALRATLARPVPRFEHIVHRD